MSLRCSLRNLINKLFGRKIPIYVNENEIQSFSNKYALIFGGTGGIGTAIVDKLIKNGCSVIICTQNKQTVEKNTNCKEKNIFYVYFDLNRFEKYESYFKDIFDKLPKIDFLILSAGVHIANPDFKSINFDDFDKVMDIDLKSVYFCSQFISNYWILKKQKGKILIVSSSRGFEPARSPYGIAKAGLNGFVKGLAEIMIDHGIIVNAISPGVTATKLLNYENGQSIDSSQNKLHRLIVPEEVAELAMFLLSDFSNSIVGENVLISGGRGRFDIR